MKIEMLPLAHFVSRRSVNLKPSRDLEKAMSVLGVA